MSFKTKGLGNLVHLSHKSPIRRDLRDRKLTSQVETTGSLRLDICAFPECHVAAAWESSQTDPLGETESERSSIEKDEMTHFVQDGGGGRGDLKLILILNSLRKSHIYFFYQYLLISYPYLLYINIWIFHPSYLFLFRWRQSFGEWWILKPRFFGKMEANSIESSDNHR